MATITGKKLTAVTEKTELEETDLMLIGDKGTANLRRLSVANVITSLKKLLGIDTLNTKIKDYIIIRSVTLNQMTLDAYWDGTTTGTIPTISGYTPVMATMMSSEMPDVCWCLCYIDGNNTISARLKNTWSEARTFSPKAQVLYVKS